LLADVDLKEMKRLTSEGDQNVKLRKVAKGVISYEKAVALCDGLDVPKRDVSVLLCKLSQAKFDQGKKASALADALSAVKKDSSCFEVSCCFVY
jgi:hypothetical protein